MENQHFKRKTKSFKSINEFFAKFLRKSECTYSPWRDTFLVLQKRLSLEMCEMLKCEHFKTAWAHMYVSIASPFALFYS